MTGKVAGEAQADRRARGPDREDGDPSKQSLGTIGRKTGNRQEDWTVEESEDNAVNYADLPQVK